MTQCSAERKKCSVIPTPWTIPRINSIHLRWNEVYSNPLKKNSVLFGYNKPVIISWNTCMHYACKYYVLLMSFQFLFITIENYYAFGMGNHAKASIAFLHLRFEKSTIKNEIWNFLFNNYIIRPNRYNRQCIIKPLDRTNGRL